jgi:predicted lipoprotein with Yx(FWY)xxD motif
MSNNDSRRILRGEKMKKFTMLSLMLLGFGSAVSHAITVKESDITGKTDLVLIGTVSLNGETAKILTDADGMSLYTFTQDSSGVSTCKGGCLTEWPPMIVPADKTVAAPFGTIKGNNGKAQLTLNGLPLYHYDDDKKPGDAFGQYPSWDAILIEN